jgi:hypothetical protein
MIVEFDPDRAYGDVVVKGKSFETANYLQVPIIGWLHNNVGALLTKDFGEITHGDGWEIFTDWQNYDWQTIKTYVKITKSVDDQLITKFWMKFGK